MDDIGRDGENFPFYGLKDLFTRKRKTFPPRRHEKKYRKKMYSIHLHLLDLASHFKHH